MPNFPTKPDLGAKHDGGKPRWFMLMTNCAKALAGIMGVLEFGAKKYSPGSWVSVPDAEIRYKDALYRHLHELELGNLRDEESGLLHYDHIATNALFLSELAHRGEPKQGAMEQLELPLK